MPKEKILIFLSFLTTIVFLSSLFVFAWQEPTSNPPGGNVYAPINTGPSSQVKDSLLGATQFRVQGWDAVYKALDTGGGVNRTFHLIGTYHGWDSEAIYIAGYNYYNPAGGNTANSYAKKVHFGHPEKVTIDLNTGDVTATGQICDKNGCIGDSTTYWTRSADNTKLYPNNTGWNVGIGTTGPHGKLDIKQGHGDWISLSRTAGSGFWHIHNPSSQERIEVGYTPDSGSTKWGIFVIKNNGNVGIGTTSPSQKLDVRGNIVIRKGYYSQLHIISDDYWAGIEIRTQSASEGHPHIDFTNNHSSNYGVRIYAPNDNKLTITGGDLEVNKITVNQIDPVYKIKDKKYVTYMPDMIGQKLEVVGEGKTQNGIFEVDLAKQKEGSDLWLFYNVVKEKTIIPFVSSQSDASLYAYINGSKFIVKVREGNKNAKFSYRLIGTRKDYQKTDNLLKEDASIYIDIDALEK